MNNLIKRSTCCRVGSDRDWFVFIPEAKRATVHLEPDRDNLKKLFSDLQKDSFVFSQLHERSGPAFQTALFGPYWFEYTIRRNQLQKLDSRNKISKTAESRRSYDDI